MGANLLKKFLSNVTCLERKSEEMQQTEEAELEDIDVVVSVGDVMSRMREYSKYEYALGILDSIDASKRYAFAVVLLRDGRCADMLFDETGQSEEEIIVERDLELREDTVVGCVGWTWCKQHGKEALHAHALQAGIDYIDSYIEKERHRCNA